MLQARIVRWQEELLAKGIEQGIEQGKIKLLERLLILKFGSLPTWAQN